jgi:DNA-binding protein YbaB
MVKQCLRNDPHERPKAEELLARLQRMKVEVEGEYGGGVVKVDISRMKLAKEVKELTQQLVW